MNLALSDLCIMGTLFPECVINFLCGGVWQFGEYACIVHAFCGALFGYGQITTLVFVSFDRYNVIVRGFAAKPLSYMKVFVFVTFIWLYASFWSIGPFFGFGGYALDGIMASCSFDYLNLDPGNVSYIWGCFAFCFCLPLTLIVLCYYNIVKAVWAHEKALKDQAKKMNVASLRSNDDAAKQSAEIRIAKVAMINITLWVIAWTPFAVICLIGITGDQKLLTPLVSTLPILFAKTSCVYNPLIYAISHPKFRQVKCLRQPSTIRKSQKIISTYLICQLLILYLRFLKLLFIIYSVPRRTCPGFALMNLSRTISPQLRTRPRLKLKKNTRLYFFSQEALHPLVEHQTSSQNTDSRNGLFCDIHSSFIDIVYKITYFFCVK